MCDAPKRSWAGAFQPPRLILGLAASTTVAAGAIVEAAIGSVLIGLGAVLLLAAVVLPTIREVEFGFPSGVKVVAAVQSREEELRQAFRAQKGDLELSTQLLCDEPVLAARLLESAWSKAATGWRGPVTPDLRIYVLCLFVHLLTAETRWGQAQLKVGTGNESLLSSLSLNERIAVVLLEFANLSPAEIARLTGRSPAQLEADLHTAEVVLGRLSAQGGVS